PLDGWVHRPYVTTDVDAVAVGQAGVQDGHVRPQRRYPTGRLDRGAGLADHLDVALRLQQVGQAAPDHLVVVEQVHTDHHPFVPCRRRRPQGRSALITATGSSPEGTCGPAGPAPAAGRV